MPTVCEDLNIAPGSMEINSWDSDAVDIALIVKALMPSEKRINLPSGWNNGQGIFETFKTNPGDMFVGLNDERPEGYLGYLVLIRRENSSELGYRWKTAYYGI